MRSTLARISGLTLALCCAAAVSAGAPEKPQRAFAKSWRGARVVVKQAIYTLVYDELTRAGATRRQRLEGLTIITPSLGTYYEFAGREEFDDITDRDPNRLMDKIAAVYRPAQHFGVDKPIQPKFLIRSDVGVELIVSEVTVQGDRVRFELRKPSPDSFTTTLTVKWPIMLSEAFTERAVIESVLTRVIEPRQP